MKTQRSSLELKQRCLAIDVTMIAIAVQRGIDRKEYVMLLADETESKNDTISWKNELRFTHTHRDAGLSQNRLAVSLGCSQEIRTPKIPLTLVE